MKVSQSCWKVYQREDSDELGHLPQVNVF